MNTDGAKKWRCIANRIWKIFTTEFKADGTVDGKARRLFYERTKLWPSSTAVAMRTFLLYATFLPLRLADYGDLVLH